ncbi:HD domain-containing protein [Spartinivicinus ruber]|uniref:HD domain-containing protein n=1 Tax=Spartinivicinus ruber TaxID=2683272 RepID=UPI0013D1D00C|nr:hypothetical protein [Spartinivicinus ruber]
MNSNLLCDYWHKYLDQSEHQLVAKQALNKIIQQYSQPWRHYHTLNHIEQMLLLFKQYESSITSPPTVFFSICFHDYYYLPWWKNNEKRSADKAIYTLEQLHFGSLNHDVAQMIIATEKHLPLTNQAPSLLLDCQLFLDFDLAVLGHDWKNYQHYCQQIRKEYWFIPKKKYLKGRKKILSTFLTRDKLYFSEEFNAQFEQQARDNIQREIQLLSKL